LCFQLLHSLCLTIFPLPCLFVSQLDGWQS
jgi:hypothetical protein